MNIANYINSLYFFKNNEERLGFLLELIAFGIVVLFVITILILLSLKVIKYIKNRSKHE